MNKLMLSAILVAGCASHSYAQTTDTPPQQPQPVKTEKMVDHNIGVQINGLIRQVFNFNNSTSSNTPVNPYLFTYSINSRKSGWGLRLGVGYDYSDVKEDDGLQNSDKKNNDMQLRIGGEKRFLLSGKWQAGAAVDFVYNTNDDHTKSTLSGTLGGTTETKTKISSYGGGPSAYLRYSVTPRILVGTEASFYYVSGKNSSEVTAFDPNNGGFTSSKSNTKFSSGTFSSPLVFFLMVKF